VVATDFPARAEAVAAILVRERVDLVGLQEVARWSRGVASPGDGAAVGSATPPEDVAEVWLDFTAELLAALARTGHEYDVHAATPNFHGGAQVAGHEVMSVLGHNLVLVRRGSGVRLLGEHAGDFARTLDIATGMPDLALDVARSWSWVDAEVDGRPFRFVNTHLEAWDEPVRNAQRDELLAQIGTPGVPVVVVGDFNATPDRVAMPPEYVDAWAAAGAGAEADQGATCGEDADLTGGSDRLGVRIDYVFVRDAKVVGCRVVGNRAEDRTPSGLWPSDHAGVVAEIAL
jgi:endonuclease/exonuclease/phosphatase family metal-dependent hydrolase